MRIHLSLLRHAGPHTKPKCMPALSPQNLTVVKVLRSWFRAMYRIWTHLPLAKACVFYSVAGSHVKSTNEGSTPWRSVALDGLQVMRSEKGLAMETSAAKGYCARLNLGRRTRTAQSS